MQSDKYICVREKGRGSTNSSQEVVIVNLADPHSILRNPTAAESAIMNPSSCVIALRGKTTAVCVPYTEGSMTAIVNYENFIHHTFKQGRI